MALKVFGTDPENQPKPRQSFADDVVGRFRSGYQVNDKPQALQNWRITTGDPEVADKVFDLYGGDAPQEWPAKGEDNLEVFTASPDVEIIIEKPSDLRQRMVLWGRNGKLIEASDGAVLTFPEERAGEEDPDARLTLAERKQKARDGFGKEPSIEVYFRLAAEPDLGVFKFVSGSWSLATDLATPNSQGFTFDEALEEVGGPAKATLALEEVSFVAKNGARKGQTVQYTKPVLTLKGAA